MEKYAVTRFKDVYRVGRLVGTTPIVKNFDNLQETEEYFDSINDTDVYLDNMNENVTLKSK